jgi:hypothetical protein
VTYTVIYTGADTITLAEANIILNKTGTANGTIAVTGTGNTTRTVTISGITGNGTLGILIASGTASDSAGNQAAASSASFTFTIDNTAPTVAIGSPSPAATKAGPVTYEVTYTGADTVTLADANITLNKTGTTNGTIAVTGTGNTTRTVTISGITGDGTLGISIAAGTASDTAGNLAAASGPSSTFTVDNKVIIGDINGDVSVDLKDAILALQLLSGMTPAGVRPDYELSGTDVNGDGKIGLQEVLYILQKVSGMRLN